MSLAPNPSPIQFPADGFIRDMKLRSFQDPPRFINVYLLLKVLMQVTAADTRYTSPQAVTVLVEFNGKVTKTIHCIFRK
jgi:hypothetical protein